MFQIENKIKDFEFYYLVELTRQKIKPLSRWEKPLPVQANRWLRHHGLVVEKIPRKTLSGKKITETVFSTSRNYTDVYLRKFSNTLICNSAENQVLEGFLFGYPSCCVQQFIFHPYAPNGISQEIQSLLFHWACDSCRSTPGLVPYYQSVHQRVLDWYQLEFSPKKRNRSYGKLLYKAVAALLIIGSCLSAQTISENTHYIPLPGDINENGLTFAEEIYLGAYDAGNLSDNCQTFAVFFKSMIDSLPDTSQIDQTYKLDHYMRGVVECPKCGLNVNMGFVTLINPLRNLQMDIPYLGIHFMEHGFFSYGTEENYQRIEIDTLKKILYPFDTQHLLPVQNDLDNDGLTDEEEDSLWLADTGENPDVNNNGVPDGVEIAEELTRLFPKLKEQADGIHSSVKFSPMYGLENCQICGSTHNMGYIEITNPENNRTCEIPYLSLHAMAHGSFTCNGSVHQNQRTNVIELYRAMKTHMLFIDNDSDNDGIKDVEEDYFDFDPNIADSNQNGLCDGMELAIALVNRIKSLPTVESTHEPYVEYLDMDGVQLCAVCGKEIPMGVIKIYNPLINTLPMEFSYYAFHFLEKGSFACEGAEICRIDPKKLSDFSDFPVGIHIDPKTSLPEKFQLRQNYPNPFNPQTVISYFLSERSEVSLKIYNICGQEIKTLVNHIETAGNKYVIWDGTSSDNRDVSTGVYLYKLTVNGVSQIRKMFFSK